jgi:DNA (cytosine-5)-methyltransferase 1
VFKGTAKRHIGQRRVQLLWASPGCTNHSAGKNGKALDPDDRATANSVLEWCRDLTVDRVILENVARWLLWGELDAKGRPIPERKGMLFQKWVRALRRMGYTVEWRMLCAADFTTPTSRTRLFVQAVRRASGKKIVWPEPWVTRDQWTPASAIIDWSDTGTPLHLRAKPLCPRTLDRLEYGIRRYWGEMAEPYIVILRGQSKTRDIHQPIPTLTAGGGHLGLVCPIDNGSNKGGCLLADEPLSTIVTKERHSLAVPLVAGKHSNSQYCPADTAPMPTLSTESGPNVASPLLVNYYGTGIAVPTDARPMPTVTTKARFGLLVPHELAIGYRMLRAPELAMGSGFDRSYKFAGTHTQIVHQIGNAVPPQLALAQVLPYLEEFKS